jgi:hypothetical protein
MQPLIERADTLAQYLRVNHSSYAANRFRELEAVRALDAQAANDRALDIGAVANAEDRCDSRDYQALHTPTASTAARGSSGGASQALLYGTGSHIEEAGATSVLPLPGYIVAILTPSGLPVPLPEVLQVTRLQHRSLRITASAARVGLDMSVGSNLADALTRPNSWLLAQFGLTALECRKLRQLLQVAAVGASRCKCAQHEADKMKSAIATFQYYGYYRSTHHHGLHDATQVPSQMTVMSPSEVDLPGFDSALLESGSDIETSSQGEGLYVGCRTT